MKKCKKEKENINKTTCKDCEYVGNCENVTKKEVIKMRDIEEKILKSLEDDIKILKRANTKTNEIKDHIRNFRDFSNDNTEEYKKEIDKLMEGLK